VAKAGDKVVFTGFTAVVPETSGRAKKVFLNVSTNQSINQQN
jgi:hypothetical protein